MDAAANNLLRHPMHLVYRLGFRYLFWMYFGDRWATVVVFVATLWFLLLGVLNSDVGLAAFGLAFLLGGPVLFPVGFMLSAGTLGYVGREIDIVIDFDGVRGWPVLHQVDRSWGRLNWARTRRSVIVLEFLFYKSRRGWVVVPKRAIGATQREYVRRLLVRHGNLDPFPDSPESPDDD